MFIAIGQNAWGKGKTRDDAVKEMKKHLFNKKSDYVVFETADENARVHPIWGSVISSKPVKMVELKGVLK